MATASALWVRRLCIAAVVAVSLGYIPYHMYASSGLARYVKLRGERDALHAANLKLYAEHQQLKAELEGLTAGAPAGQLSLEAVERAARDELGLVKPGELVFKVEAASARHLQTGAGR
jgi:cell division protein FtsB